MLNRDSTGTFELFGTEYTFPFTWSKLEIGDFPGLDDETKERVITNHNRQVKTDVGNKVRAKAKTAKMKDPAVKKMVAHDQAVAGLAESWGISKEEAIQEIADQKARREARKNPPPPNQ